MTVSASEWADSESIAAEPEIIAGDELRGGDDQVGEAGEDDRADAFVALVPTGLGRRGQRSGGGKAYRRFGSALGHAMMLPRGGDEVTVARVTRTAVERSGC